MEHLDYDENEFENEYESPGKENRSTPQEVLSRKGDNEGLCCGIIP